MKQITLYIVLLIVLISCKSPTLDEGSQDKIVQDSIKKESTTPAQKVVLSPPSSTTATFNNHSITIDYSAPSVRNREIFGGTLPFNKVWRAGAGRATWIETPVPLFFEQGTLPAGKYGVFMIPSVDHWIIIFNSHWDQDGNAEYNMQQDVLRLQLKPLITPVLTEQLVYELRKTDESNGSIHFAWEKAVADFVFSLAPR